ncbi:antiterminator Q family protein [Rahnella inusitata]|uniref:antiterminator Q family protein n=1 Tax=Rahnella inusitata TaxID=58169 RepID=UPI001BC82F58|nr:antiterminator Q family protein [Rahnella inusitata]QUT14559.1 antitermination protein [Rahnella inusitata]
MRDIQLVLERWGVWASQEGSQVDWSPISGGFKSLLPKEGRSRPSCCDNDGSIVDTAVGMLRKAGRQDELDLVMLHYMYDVSKSTIARWKKCSEGKIRNQLMIAETFVDACIMMTGVRLEMDDWTHKSEFKKVA